MQQHESCLLCESKKLKDLKSYERHYLCQCQDCNFVFIKRIPTIEELEKYYKNYGAEHFLSPITIKRYHALLDEFEPYRKHNRILDVGCGVGHFLSVAKERGWEVHGVEFSKEAAEICRQKGISMQEGQLDSSLFEPESFDIVTSFEVLEHINYPKQDAQQIHNLLRKNGLFYCTTPNFDSLMRYYLKADFNVIHYPEHLGYFTVSTLKKLFQNTGFKTQKVLTTGFSFTRLAHSRKKKETQKPKPQAPKPTSEKKKYKDAFNPESSDEKVRQAIEGNPILEFAKKTANALLTLSRTGLSLKGYFIKK
ncbi:MAG: class I SAM-dependent methyltransferase [Bernardetiaceae bacterium]|nr:class I SAM-dependent methyltransferase [Bernardetiaceae bacterium]